ncbi:MAG: hypothetical protein CH6_0251 [Candidatus Kapaibacterium sp.]|nr:MAG: hypothetical protein CH6_0251 [Candidatus Kapabacteria bacterium]
MASRFLSLFLIILIGFSSNKGLVYWLEYKLNYGYIVKNLCVERENPNNTCRGCCHLKSNLQKDSDEQQNKTIPLPVKNKLQESNHLFFVQSQGCKFFTMLLNLPLFFTAEKIVFHCSEPPTPPPKYQ